MKKEIDITEVHQICSSHGIEIREVSWVAGSFAKKIFFINQEFLLRFSETPMTGEQEKFRRVASLNAVPKIIHAGTLARDVGPISYTLLTLLPGDDFVNVYSDTTEAQQSQLGKDTAGFLDDLQKLTGTNYDIGLYVPAIAKFPGSWREGHQNYWELLSRASENIVLKPESQRVFVRAFRFLAANSAVLDYQTGPTLLHNDLHPKNILLAQGKFSGVIDWECSQYGEPDFELCHFIHWTVYPPEPAIDFRIFLRGLFEAAPHCAQVPHLAQRLTIYQVEHEIQQIVWNASQAESWRIPRLIGWMDGGVDALFEEMTI